MCSPILPPDSERERGEIRGQDTGHDEAGVIAVPGTRQPRLHRAGRKTRDPRQRAMRSARDGEHMTTNGTENRNLTLLPYLTHNRGRVPAGAARRSEHDEWGRRDAISRAKATVPFEGRVG